MVHHGVFYEWAETAREFYRDLRPRPGARVCRAPGLGAQRESEPRSPIVKHGQTRWRRVGARWEQYGRVVKPLSHGKHGTAGFPTQNGRGYETEQAFWGPLTCNKPKIHRPARGAVLTHGIVSDLLCLAIAFPQISFAQTAPTGLLTLTWDANTESDLAGYKVYRSTTSGTYGAPIVAIQGNVTTYQATNLTIGQTYYFVVTAYDTSGNESDFSNEASGTPPDPVSVPNLVGLTQATAEAAITGAGLVVGTVSTATSDSMPAGLVISQTPGAEASVAPGSAVNLVVSSGSPPPPVISNLYEIVDSGLQVGATVYIDRSFTYSAVPPSLLGATYIKTANDHKLATTDSFLTFEANQPVTIYVAHDNRITVKPAWLSAFADVGEDLVTSDTTLHLFTKNFPAGLVVLGGNQGVSISSMYTVVIASQSGPPPPPLLVPNVVGLTRAAAEAAITDAGLVVGTVSTATSDSIPVGLVISQTPGAEASVALGSAVTLVVSSTLVTVPDVLGQLQAQAATALTTAGLVLGTVTTVDSAAPATERSRCAVQPKRLPLSPIRPARL